MLRRWDFRAYDPELLMEILDIFLESEDLESRLRRRRNLWSPNCRIWRQGED
jgi:hypothetical protein